MVRILAATDFTEEGQAVLDFAAEMVCKTGGKMYLLHAVEPCIIDAAGSLSGGSSMGAGDIPGNLPNVDYQRMDACQAVLTIADARAKQLGEQISRKWGIPIYAKAEESDDIVDCVHQFCRRHNITQLVIGNRHHSLLTSILLGNTAEKLVRASRIPVTVVPCGSKAHS